MGNDSVYNTWGVRPAAVFDIGWFELKGAYEYAKGILPGSVSDGTNTSKRRGWGPPRSSCSAPWVEMGFDAGAALFDQFDSTGLVTDRMGDTVSFGGS